MNFLCITSSYYLLYKKDSLFETSDLSRWDAIRANNSIVVDNSFAKGKRRSLAVVNTIKKGKRGSIVVMEENNLMKKQRNTIMVVNSIGKKGKRNSIVVVDSYNRGKRRSLVLMETENKFGKRSTIVLANTFADGELRKKSSIKFSNFMNAIHYAADAPNFQASPFSVFKLLSKALFFLASPKASNHHKMCNTLNPNLEITKL
jgi:hypothetical protein